MLAWLVVSDPGLVIGLAVPDDSASTGNILALQARQNRNMRKSLTMFGLGIFCVLGHQFLPTNIFELQVKARKDCRTSIVDEYCGLFCVYVIQLFLLLFSSRAIKILLGKQWCNE